MLSPSKSGAGRITGSVYGVAVVAIEEGSNRTITLLSPDSVAVVSSHWHKRTAQDNVSDRLIKLLVVCFTLSFAFGATLQC